MELMEKLRESPSPFVIYGAQVVAHGAYVAIKRLCGKVPECFAVSRREGNPTEIDGVPVRLIGTVAKNTLIVVGVTELVQKEVVPFLEREGYRDVFVLTQHEEHLLMSAYFDRIGRFPPVSEKACVDAVDLALYEVKCHADKPLAYHPGLFSWERPVQAGAELTDKRIAGLLDNTGIHISQKNKQYCEMTAAYWVWKNTKHDWKGIEHYRRHLLVRPGMLGEGVDAVMPLPYICYPNTVAQFRRFVSEAVLQALLKALRELHPDVYEDYRAILYGQYQYTYNLVCARREVFDDYCRWFFGITEYMETLAGEVPEIGETRALSYVAEVLTNLYFMYHQERLCIRHVEKAIYV